MFFYRQALKCAPILLCIIIFMSLTVDKAYAGRYFLIERPLLGLEFSYEFEKDERKGTDTESRDTSMTFSERVDIETKGWVYHPALVIYKLGLSPEWEQISEEADRGEKKKTEVFLQGYFTEFTFLQYKPYTLRIFAEKRMSTLKSSFARRSKTESDGYGAMFMLKYSVLPTTFSYNHLESTQTGFYTTDKGTDEFRLIMSYNKNLGDTKLDAYYINTDQTTRGTLISTIQQRASLQNSYNLTEDKRVTLSSNLSYRDTQSDFTKNTRYNFYENLFWRHRRNLTTRYIFRYDITDYEAGSRKSKALQFNLTHLLYENLTTSLNVSGNSNRFTGEEELGYGAKLDFNYRRRIPWGMLSINVGHDYKITERDITAGFMQVIDESVTLTGYEIALLANEHVDVSSIVLTDNTGTTIYMEDMDYRVTETGSFIGISRKTGTGITDGQEVYVSYKYLSNPAFDYSTFGQSYGVNLNLWSAWRIYYKFDRSKQEFLSGIPPDRPIDDTIHTAGTVLKWKWSRTKLEFKNKETTNMPSTSWRAEETVTLRPFKKVFFSFSGNYGKTKFKDTGEIETFNNISANIQVLTSRWSKFNVQCFRDMISGQTERTTDLGILSIFEWYYGIWSGSLSYRFLNEKDDIDQEDNKNHYVLFKIKRRLF